MFTFSIGVWSLSINPWDCPRGTTSLREQIFECLTRKYKGKTLSKSNILYESVQSVHIEMLLHFLLCKKKS
jgi:hypothetical protein